MFPGVAASRGPVDIGRAHSAYGGPCLKHRKSYRSAKRPAKIIAKDENTHRFILAVGPDRRAVRTKRANRWHGSLLRRRAGSGLN